MAFKEAAETARQELTGDDKFFQSFVYFFELQAPAAAFGGAAIAPVSLLFPLMIAPEGYHMSEPFAVNATPGHDGGLVVEENGIVQRMIRLTGTTGWKPRALKASMGFQFLKLDHPSFTPRGRMSPLALSGQRHFQFLNDKVFRTYGDLKRDPATAKETAMVFHNIKDDEHWLVVPREFRLDRDAHQPTLYKYTIELLVVDKASAVHETFASEDKGILDQIKDTIRTIRSYADMAIGAVKDVTALVNELENIVQGIGNTLRRVSSFLDSVTALIEGTADFIKSPFSQIAALVTELDGALERLAAAPFVAADSVLHSFRQMQDALDGFALHPEVFETETYRKLAGIREQSEISTSRSSTALADAAASPPTSLAELAKAGTKPQPGDQDRARGELGAGRNEPVFNSAVEYVMKEGDSLTSLAARFLGNANLWRQIAVLNNLRAPFVSAHGLPGTKRPGDRIMIPSTARAVTTLPNAAVVGARPTEDLADRLLGRDLLLAPSSRNPRLLDLAVDTTKNRTDFRTVSGIANLVQAVQFRVRVEQGTDVLYRNLGYKALIGINIPEVDAEILRLRLGEAIAADSRIASIGSVRLNENASPDTIDVELDAVVRGFNDPITVTASGPVLA